MRYLLPGVLLSRSCVFMADTRMSIISDFLHDFHRADGLFGTDGARARALARVHGWHRATLGQRRALSGPFARGRAPLCCISPKVKSQCSPFFRGDSSGSDVEQVKRATDALTDGWSTVVAAGHTTYLGYEVGPRAGPHLWQKPLQKRADRTRALGRITLSPSVTILAYSIRALTCLSYAALLLPRVGSPDLSRGSWRHCPTSCPHTKSCTSSGSSGCPIYRRRVCTASAQETFGHSTWHDWTKPGTESCRRDMWSPRVRV